MQLKRALELVFKIAYLLLALISFNVLFARHGYISVFSYLVVALAVAVGVIRLFHIRDYLNIGIYILFSFIISYILGAVNTLSYGYMDNVKAIIWMMVQFFLIFAFDKNADYLEERNIVFKIFLGYTGISAVGSIIMMMTNWQYFSLVDGIYWIMGGFVDNRLWGTYTDPNYGSIMAIISIILSIKYLTETDKPNKYFKFLLIANIILEFLYICYSDSRTGLLAIGASIFVLLVVWFAKQKGLFKSVVLSIVLIGVIIALIYGTRLATSAIKVEIAKVVATRAGLSQEEIEAEMYFARVGRLDNQIGEGSDISNNRFDIWGNAIEIFKQHPVAGISYRNIREYAYDKIPDTYAGFESMHNFFFDILVSQGIIGVTILFMLMGWVIWTLIKKYKSLTNYREFAFMMAIIAAIFASMLTYSETFYMNTGGAFIFWYVLGYLVNYKEKGQEKTKLAEV